MLTEAAAGRRRDSSFSMEGAANPSSRLDFSNPPRPVLGSLVLMMAAAESTRTTAGTSAAGSAAADFFRPAVFLAEEEMATSSRTTFPLETRVSGNKAELL